MGESGAEQLIFSLFSLLKASIFLLSQDTKRLEAVPGTSANHLLPGPQAATAYTFLVYSSRTAGATAIGVYQPLLAGAGQTEGSDP
jgi:hypothetical protein